MSASSQLSHTTTLLWHIAAQIAADATDDYLRPPHFLLALCRITQLPIAQLKNSDGVTAAVVDEIEGEIKELRHTFQHYNISIDDMAVRALRSIARPNRYPVNGVWHRCPLTREIFSAAHRRSSTNRKVTLSDMLHVMISLPQHSNN